MTEEVNYSTPVCFLDELLLLWICISALILLHVCNTHSPSINLNPLMPLQIARMRLMSLLRFKRVLFWVLLQNPWLCWNSERKLVAGLLDRSLRWTLKISRSYVCIYSAAGSWRTDADQVRSEDKERKQLEKGKYTWRWQFVFIGDLCVISYHGY